MPAMMELPARHQLQQLLRGFREAHDSLADLDTLDSILGHRHRQLPRVPRVEADVLEIEHLRAPLHARLTAPGLAYAPTTRFNEPLAPPSLRWHPFPVLTLPDTLFRNPEERQH